MHAPVASDSITPPEKPIYFLSVPSVFDTTSGMIESNFSTPSGNHTPPYLNSGAVVSPDQSDAPKTVRPLDQPLTVLVVEDDTVDFMHVSRSLRHGSPTLLLSHATTFQAAKKELAARHFDVILADLHLPDSSGPPMIKQLTELSRGAPILVLTGLIDERVEHEILDSGAQDFLPKGVASANWIRKAILHAVQRQDALNEMNHATHQLQESHKRLRHQSELREEENQKLERLYQTAHEFLAKASHDIRNPLSVIKEHVSVVRDGLVGQVNPEQTGMLEKAMVRADDVNAKLDDLLDSSKLDAGLLDICRRACTVDEIIEQVRGPLSQRAAMRGIELEVASNFRMPMAFCDEEKAARVLTGLGINAINACGESGHVNVWVRHEPREQEILIGVTDDGVGIMPSQRDRLAARFARPGLSTEPDDKLLGLGLSIATRFCRINFGRLNVTSEVGLGSVFWFSIPVVASTKVFPRWLELQRDPKRHVHLLHLSLPDQCSDSEQRDGELLVTYLTESDELLLGCSPKRWWLATSSVDSDGDARIEKARAEIHRLTQVRAASSDFRLQIKTKASWDLLQPVHEIVSEFRSITAD